MEIIDTGIVSADLDKIQGCMLSETQLAGYKEIIPMLTSWRLNQRQLCDVELILNGGFSPLIGFMSELDYHSVCQDLQLVNNAIWPIPVVLDVNNKFADQLQIQQLLALRDAEGVLIAILQISDIWQPDKLIEAQQVYGTINPEHWGVDYLLNCCGDVYLGGRLFGVNLPSYWDFPHLRNTPQQCRSFFKEHGWEKVVGFQTRNPMHKAHQELTLNAAEQAQAKLLIHPAVGATKIGDIDYITRVKCYEKIIQYYPKNTTMLSLLPLAMRMAGPREAILHAIIRKNYGCSHFIVGRDHAGPGSDSSGIAFYTPYAAQQLVQQYQQQLGIMIIPFQEYVYVQETKQYIAASKITTEQTVLKISGTELRRRLELGSNIPEWFSFSDVIKQLKQRYPARFKRGVTLFFTGLSGAGKSTIAHVLLNQLMIKSSRSVTLLDGDQVRNALSSDLGFSKQDRDLNILRIGYVAAEITKHAGIAICAPIAPYAKTRMEVRKLVEKHGNFIEIYVDTPLVICEKRDRKGLYAKARTGIIKNFTGIDDPYEVPVNPDIIISTINTTAQDCAEMIIDKLVAKSYLRIDGYDYAE